MPGIVENSWATPRTRAAVIAAPGSELRSTRRSEFPRVVPYPGGSGSHANFAYRSSPSMRSILGYSSSTRVMASVPSCGASALVSALRLHQRSSRLGLASSRVMLDDELGVDLCFDLITTRRREDFRGVRVGIDLEPARTCLRLRPGGHLLEVVGAAALLGDGDGVAGLHRVARRLGRAAVDGDVAVSHELPRLRARLRESGAVHRVVEAPLEVDEERLTRRAGHFGGAVERVLHLALEHAVHATRLLLLAKLEREVAHLAAALLVHAGWRRALLERALGEALLALEEELHALPAADAADGSGVTSHQTRLRFGGRQPLCGIGVTSVIAVTSRPVASSARIAASRPAPGPRTKTSTVLSPRSSALRAAFSAATCAAYGVLFREPFHPEAPADDHAITFPAGSVSEMIVLLKEAFTCAAPRGTTRFSRRRRGAAFGSAPGAPGASVSAFSAFSAFSARAGRSGLSTFSGLSCFSCFGSAITSSTPPSSFRRPSCAARAASARWCAFAGRAWAG